MPLSCRRMLAAAAVAVVWATTPQLAAPAWGISSGAEVSDVTELTELEQHDRRNLLAVVTKTQAIEPLDYVPDDLVDWRGGPFQLRAEVVQQLEKMFAEGEDAGIGLRVISGFRSYETQAGTYDYWVRHYGQASADVTSARPGHSEHQTGLAVDLDDLTGGCYLDACFGETEAGRWIAEHGHRFGFVLSYPEGSRDRTGFTYEPWHLRYVGPVAAGHMRQLGIELLQDYARASTRGAVVSLRLGS